MKRAEMGGGFPRAVSPSALTMRMAAADAARLEACTGSTSMSYCGAECTRGERGAKNRPEWPESSAMKIIDIVRLLPSARSLNPWTPRELPRFAACLLCC